MGSRFPSHQLGNGLYVSGRPEQPKEKPPTLSSTAMPYTGGDIKKSGELGKMFEIHAENSKLRKSGPISTAPSRSSSFAGVASHSGPVGPNPSSRTSSNRQKSNSGPINRHGDPIKKSSGPQSGVVTPMTRQNSGPLTPVLPTTGLITSGPFYQYSGPLNSAGVSRKISGPLDTGKLHSSVTILSQEDGPSFKGSFPKPIVWSVILLFVMGLIAGGFIFAAVHNAILLIVVVVMSCLVGAIILWNTCWGRRAITGFISSYPDAQLRAAKNGQYIKISGVVTCGTVPLESSFQKVPRCVYTSTGLYEYRGWDSKAANDQHRRFSWGLRSLERHVVDFYISDFHTGLRALVKTGYGAKVTPYVDESTVIDITPENKDSSPEFLRWLGQRNLSCDDRVMRLKEGYIKEGSSVSVMGVVQRNENVLMIVPPSEPFSTGCGWLNCILPANLEGVVIRCEDTSKIDVIPV